MAVMQSADTEFGKELAKWNTPKSQGGYKCDGHEEFPRMVYQAWQRSDGRVLVLDESDSRRGWTIAKNGRELEKLRGLGWFLTVEDAVEAFQAQQLAVAEEATRVAYRASTMGAKARAEFDALDQASTTHVLDVPAPKKKRRAYRRKVTPPVATE
jgi:hypothetical protein